MEEAVSVGRKGMQHPEVAACLDQGGVALADARAGQAAHEQERRGEGRAVQLERHDLRRRYAARPDPVTRPCLGRQAGRVAGLQDVRAGGGADHEVLVADIAGERAHLVDGRS
jgi:hypothetical protein